MEAWKGLISPTPQSNSSYLGRVKASSSRDLLRTKWKTFWSTWKKNHWVAYNSRNCKESSQSNACPSQFPFKSKFSLPPNTVKIVHQYAQKQTTPPCKYQHPNWVLPNLQNISLPHPPNPENSELIFFCSLSNWASAAGGNNQWFSCVENSYPSKK